MPKNNLDTSLSVAVDRRQFLLLSAAGTASLVLGIYPVSVNANDTASSPLSPVAWIEIHPDNRIIFHMSKSEMGQGVTTSLAMLVAEELNVELDQLTIKQAGYNPDYGNQNTGGSSSITSNWQRLREAGAVTRELLVASASTRWAVPANECQAIRGEIHNRKTGAKVTYGELIPIAKSLPLPKHVTLKTQNFTIIGKSQPRVDLPTKINGSAIFGSDIVLDGILTATVVHSPTFSGRLKSFDAKAALAMPGVHNIFEIDSGIAIVADNYWVTQEARKLLKINWQKAPPKSLPVMKYRELLATAGIVVENTGTTPDLAATRQLEAIYELPYQAHATMEPMCCTATVQDGQIRVWAPTQDPAQAHAIAKEHGLTSTRRFFDKLLNNVFHKPSDEVRVQVTQLGGGFGRRLQQDYVAEAVQIAKLASRPVRLVWSREEDLQHDFYRPATVHKLTAHIQADASITSWQHKIVGGSVSEYLWPGSTGKRGDSAMVEGATHLPYAMTHRQVEYVKLISTVPLGYWRSVGHSHNAFVKESFIDELAHAARIDPLQYRIQLLQQHPEMIAVLQLAAAKAAWGSALAPGHYHGVALHSAYGSHVAQVAEISIEENHVIRVHKVTCAIDCGTVVNPDAVRAQIESAVVFGLTATLKSAITVEDDQVQQSNFHDFPLLSMQETPHVETFFVPNPRPPAGVGEIGVPPIAPAVANAVFAATGQRLRRLPLRLQN